MIGWLTIIPFLSIYSELKIYLPLEAINSIFVMLIPVLAATVIYLGTLQEKEKDRIREENNSIVIALKEIQKNKTWCEEYIGQGIQPSIKFYNLTKIGIERCLNTLRFIEDSDFLEAIYMSIKLINIVNNVIEAIILTSQNFNPNLVNMSKESIHESEKLEIYLKYRYSKNKLILKRI